MGKFKGLITRPREDGGRGRDREVVTAARDTRQAAANAIRQSLVSGERLVYVAPDDNGDDSQDVGVFGG